MDTSPEAQIPPEAEAQQYIELLAKVSSLEPGQQPNLALAKQVSRGSRQMSTQAYNIVFTTPDTPQSIETYEQRWELLELCDQVVRKNLPPEPLDTRFQKSEHIEIAENIRLHHQLSDTIINLQNELFPHKDSTPPPQGIRRNQIGSHDIITFEADDSQLPLAPIQAFQHVSEPDNENPDELFYFRSPSRSYFAAYDVLRPGDPQISATIVLRVEDRKPDGKLSSRTEISTSSSGLTQNVEVNGKRVSPEQSKQIITDLTKEISQFKLIPPTSQ